MIPINLETKPDLSDRINASTDLNFVLIINPDSGPSNSTSLTGQYFNAVEQFANVANVQTVGYVRTGYGTRAVNDIVQDIQSYANWSTINPQLTVHGIFFDESAYEDKPGALDDQVAANEAVKNASGILNPRLVIRNPGVVPAQGLRLNTTDLTVIFEQSYSEFERKQQSLDTSGFDRSDASYIVHSVPKSANLRRFVSKISYHAEYLFVTRLHQDPYGSFGQDFLDFVKAVPR